MKNRTFNTDRIKNEKRCAELRKYYTDYTYCD